MSDPVIHRWMCGRISREAEEGLARILLADDVRRVAVMPDVHAAGVLCNGIAVGTRRRVYPEAVGGDIGCGICALGFSGGAECLDARAAGELLAGLARVCPCNRHHHVQDWPADLDPGVLSTPALQRIAARDGAVQIGTLGRGNHFLEMQVDEQGQLWLMIHSGSRAVGPAVRDHHLTCASRDPTGLLWLDMEDDAGQAYLRDAQWARHYAAASRRAMAARAAQLIERLLGCPPAWETYVDLDHNHVQRESHGGGLLWVHRKGAAPAALGQSGLIPGSMGTFSFHTEGRGCADALESSSHGAGRALSRHETRQRIGAGEVRRQLAGVWFNPRVTESLREEAPRAYKDIRQVMEAQRDLVRIVRRLRPALCHKGR